MVFVREKFRAPVSQPIARVYHFFPLSNLTPLRVDGRKYGGILSVLAECVRVLGPQPHAADT